METSEKIAEDTKGCFGTEKRRGREKRDLTTTKESALMDGGAKERMIGRRGARLNRPDVTPGEKVPGKKQNS